MFLFYGALDNTHKENSLSLLCQKFLGEETLRLASGRIRLLSIFFVQTDRVEFSISTFFLKIAEGI